MSDPKAYEAELHQSFDFAVREAGAFFSKTGRLYETLRRLTRRLDAEGIDYALVGSLALGEHGYVRMTEDVDILLTSEGALRFQERLVGRGYVATHAAASRSFRDSDSKVRIEILISGEFPGDGKPKPVTFPDPASAAIVVDDTRVLTLPRLIELKLASGMTAPHRLRDLADVQDLIRARNLGDRFAEQLDASVRGAYVDLWRKLHVR